MKNYYEILEVNEKASQEIIDKAYKTLVKKYHPDLYLYSTEQKKQSEKKLQEINEAYHVLSDEFLRSQYDIEIKKERDRANREYYQNQTTTANNYTGGNINYQYNNTNQNNFNEEKNTTGQNNSQSNNQNRRSLFSWKRKNNNVEKNNVGTIYGIIDLLKDLSEDKPKKQLEKRKLGRTDFLAMGLTVVVVIIIGVILWFIPFTNGWIRQLLFENPIFNFIGRLFS